MQITEKLINHDENDTFLFIVFLVFTWIFKEMRELLTIPERYKENLVQKSVLPASPFFYIQKIAVQQYIRDQEKYRIKEPTFSLYGFIQADIMKTNFP